MQFLSLDLMRDLSISATVLREAKHVRGSIFSVRGFMRVSHGAEKLALHLFIREQVALFQHSFCCFDEDIAAERQQTAAAPSNTITI